MTLPLSQTPPHERRGGWLPIPGSNPYALHPPSARVAFCGDGGACLTLLTLHLLGVAVFLGGLLLALYWKLAADRSNDPAFAAAVHERLRKADAQVVGPGALVTFAAGYAMVRFFGHRIAETPFALWGLILLFLALGLWYFGMRRIGDRLLDEARASRDNRQPLSKDYAARSVAWLACAFGALGLVALTAVFMVFHFPG